ncbi:hypothetical protein ACFVJ5_33900 [Nocardia sp. NPDC127606]|uniref:hypothetical protein n=1 Tax=Nocardia sp. NPDC127606 TaxID=3345406 RepID=UPI003638DC5B
MSDELRKAEILFELGRHAAARDLLGPLVAAEPDYGMAWAFLGYAWSQDGEPTRALEAARTALRVEPDNLFAWKIIVLAENQLRERADTEQAAAARSDRALRAADRCVELDPMSADCALHLDPGCAEALPTPSKPPPGGWPTENPWPPRPYLTPAPLRPGD